MNIKEWLKKNKDICDQGVNCPECTNNQGWFVEEGYDGEPEQFQCQFCYTEVDSVFNLKGLSQAVKIIEDTLEIFTLIEKGEFGNGDYLDRCDMRSFASKMTSNDIDDLLGKKYIPKDRRMI